jgi:HEPN domain-containing protein
MPEAMNWLDWVQFAEDDYQTALEVLEKRAPLAVNLFHISSEKYLKAVLVKSNTVPDRSHDLLKFLLLLEPTLEMDNPLWLAARELNVRLISARYPSKTPPMTKDAQIAQQQASLLRAFARERLGLETP